MKSKIMLIIATLLLAGCDDIDPPQQSLQPRYTTATKSSDRFKIDRLAVFRDSLAYENERGVYVITDHVTGKQYLGVSGIGISELGSHQAGESTVSDER